MPRRGAAGSLQRAVLLLVFTLSGASGLIYEVLWTRRLTHIFGSTTLAVSTVLAAFMGGLAVGSVLLGGWADRNRRRALRAYGLLELAIGLLGFCGPAPARAVAARLPPARAGARVFADALLRRAVPPRRTRARRALRPHGRHAADPRALARRTRRGHRRPRRRRSTPPTRSAPAPEPPPRRTSCCPSRACARASSSPWRSTSSRAPSPSLLARGSRPAAAPEASAPAPAAPEPAAAAGARASARLLLAAIALSGFAAMVDEVAWARLVGLVFGSSVYAFGLDAPPLPRRHRDRQRDLRAPAHRRPGARPRARARRQHLRGARSGSRSCRTCPFALHARLPRREGLVPVAAGAPARRDGAAAPADGRSSSASPFPPRSPRRRSCATWAAASGA